MDINLEEYQRERTVYYKVLIALLLLTAVTLIQPYIFRAGTLTVQMGIAVVKAWLILMYYMHLKGEKLISVMIVFTLGLVIVFFTITIGVDVKDFQFRSESYITAPEHTGGAAHSVAPAHH